MDSAASAIDGRDGCLHSLRQAFSSVFLGSASLGEPFGMAATAEAPELKLILIAMMLDTAIRSHSVSNLSLFFQTEYIPDESARRGFLRHELENPEEAALRGF